MKKTKRIFRTPYELAETFAGEIAESIRRAAVQNRFLTIALSGGSTPELLFSILGDHFAASSPWEHVHLFWGDERCVPPVSPDSNFGMVFRNLIRKINIPEKNVHRIFGEKDPSEEAARYSEMIVQNTRKRDKLPVFDMIILGLGEDGHTASIFPGMDHLFDSSDVCEVSVHPVTNQKRITLTGKVINNADSIKFLVTGAKKAEVVKKIIDNESENHAFPAGRIIPLNGTVEWLLDNEAAALL